MSNNEDIFNQTKIEIEKLWSDNEKLSNFVNWPKNLVLTNKSKNKINVTQKLSSWKSNSLFILCSNISNCFSCVLIMKPPDLNRT